MNKLWPFESRNQGTRVGNFPVKRCLDGVNNGCFFILALGMGLCVAFIALVRLPSLKVSTLLLVGLLVYDVFWVSLCQLSSSNNVLERDFHLQYWGDRGHLSHHHMKNVTSYAFDFRDKNTVCRKGKLYRHKKLTSSHQIQTRHCLWNFNCTPNLYSHNRPTCYFSRNLMNCKYEKARVPLVLNREKYINCLCILLSKVSFL